MNYLCAPILPPAELIGDPIPVRTVEWRHLPVTGAAGSLGPIAEALRGLARRAPGWEAGGAEALSQGPEALENLLDLKRAGSSSRRSAPLDSEAAGRRHLIHASARPTSAEGVDR